MVTKAERDANVMKVTKAWMAANGMGAGAASAAKQPFHAADSEFEATRRTVGLDPHNMNGALRGAFERAKSNPDNPYRNSPNPFRKLTPQEAWIAGALKDAEDRKAGVSPRANHFPREQRVEFYRATGPAHLGHKGGWYRTDLPGDHAAFIVKDPLTGEAFVTRAGPGKDGKLYAKTTPWDQQYAEDYPYVTYEQKIGQANMTLDQARQKMKEFHGAINKDGIEYRFLPTNSNSYESAAEANFGLNAAPPSTGRWVPGWGYDRQHLLEEDRMRKKIEERRILNGL